MSKILIVEDNRSMREMLCRILQKNGFDTADAGDVHSALSLLRNESFALILSDLQLPDIDGLTFFKRIRNMQIPFIILTAYGSIEKAVEAIKEGAFDFIAKPVDPEYLLLMAEKALQTTRIMQENVVLQELLSRQHGRPVIIGKSPAILDAAEKVRQVASADTSVLLQGESGTGKELFARAIHDLSSRSKKPFMAVNAASIPESLLENELFGHEKGSYTGAVNRQIGKLEMAMGGTFFFDEIGDFPVPLQGKILRFLEDKTISRLGTSQELELNLRFIFATNQNLEKAIAENRFRRDLYFRITAFPIFLPPLRDRSGDIPLLAEYFCGQFGRELKKENLSVSGEALRKMQQYSWPGNIRELQNTMERAAILCRENRIEETDIVLPCEEYTPSEGVSLEGTLPEVVQRVVKTVERRKITEVLESVNHVRSEAARKLGISYKTLLEKIKDHDITSP